MTPLSKIAWMNFDELSRFVKTATNGEKYIARPAEATIIDMGCCEEEILRIVIMPALKNEHKRVDSRSRKLNSDYQIALQIASAALTYWENRGFVIDQNARVKRALSAQKIDEETKERKADMIALQLNNIGAILGAKRCHKKDAIQGYFDFEESALQIARISNESEMPASYHTLEAIA